jgi:hypothetical protein
MNDIKKELEKRGARTSGSYERMVERLHRFLEVENRKVQTPPKPPAPTSPASHVPLNDPPSIIRMELDDDDLNAARILCECARTPVEERIDRLELSMMELFGNENIYHRMEDIEARIRRLERIADATEQRVYALETLTIYKNNVVEVPVFTV